MLESIAATALKAIASKLTTQIYDLFSDKSKNKIDSLNAERIEAGIHHHIKYVRQVKTLWQMDKSVDLESFYITPHVEKSFGRLKASKFTDVVTDTNVLLEGIAGQGKSILLRFLCAQLMESDSGIPIFIELRKIQKEKNITHQIIEWFDVLGIKINNGIVIDLIKKGKVTLFLDGFDEIPMELRSKSIEEIERLCKHSERTDTKTIVSSRPNSGLESSIYFEVAQLSDLTRAEYKHVIRKLSVNQIDANRLIERIEQHRGNLQDMLVTPLLVTLLLITYKSFDELPDQLSDFYEALFYALLKRHDGTKPGYVRQRRCTLNDREYREIFNAFCFETKTSASINFSRGQIHTFSDTAIKYLKLTADPNDYIEDIINITCLIVSDGEENRFIHKSVQEYFCATFLNGLPEITSKELISTLIENQQYKNWVQEFGFLQDINRYRFYKHYRLPLLKAAIRELPTNRSIKNTDLAHIYGDSFFMIHSDSKGRRQGKISRVVFHYEGAFPKEFFPTINKERLSKELLSFLNKHDQIYKDVINRKDNKVHYSEGLFKSKILLSEAKNAYNRISEAIDLVNTLIAEEEDTTFVNMMSLKSLVT